MRRRALRTLAAALLAATGLLGACSGLPDTSPVLEGRRLDEQIPDPARVSALGPVDGASQEQIALGFIRAGEDADETREKGKEYLAPSSVDLWRWGTEPVVVYNSDDDLRVRFLGPETVEVSVVAVAEVSPEGRYREQATGSVAKVTLGMTKVGGEWRIDLPRTGFGLWLDSNAFDRLYAARQVFYATPSGQRLVPDTRWFPSGSKMATMATTLARAQLGPVPEHLQGAVVTGMPPLTRLAVNAVPIDNGRATVNLSEAALDADPRQRVLMWAQLTATLSQVSAVGAVSLSVEGTALELQGFGSSISSAGELGYATAMSPGHDTALLRAERGRISRIDPRDIPSDDSVGRRQASTDSRDGDPLSIPEGWTGLAMSVDGHEVAAIGGDLAELSRWRGGDFVVMPPFGTGLTRPAYDSTGHLWVGGVAPDGTGRIWAIEATAMDSPGEAVAVAAPWLNGRRVVALVVAPDAARLLLVTTKPDGTDPQLGLAGIVRDATQTPISLAVPLRQANTLTLIKDLTWLETDSYAVLGRISADESVRPWIGRIGAGLDGVRRRGSESAQEARLSPVPGGERITSVGGPRGIIVITDDERVLARVAATWRQIATGTDLLVPGR